MHLPFLHFVEVSTHGGLLGGSDGDCGGGIGEDEGGGGVGEDEGGGGVGDDEGGSCCVATHVTSQAARSVGQSTADSANWLALLDV